MSKFQTHQSVLQFLLEECAINTILETGMGLYSTRLFVENAEQIVSLEMQSEEWYKKIKEEFKDASNFKPFLRLKQVEAYEFLESRRGPYDLIFVDGALDRWRQVNRLFSKTHLMAVHDTEADGYFWKRVELPTEWYWVDIKNLSPWTAVLTDDVELIKKIENKFICSVYDKYTFKDKNYLINNAQRLQGADLEIHENLDLFKGGRKK